MAAQPGPLRRLWYSWKTMQLPWRRKWLVGFDLQGNTYWEFKDAIHAHRNRRIVEYAGWTHHGDVNVPPQWMQWLRHTRFEAPTIAEQQAEVFRQAQMKTLAAQADARWAAKPSALDAPDKQQPVQMLESRDPSTGITQTNIDQQTREKADTQPAAAAAGISEPIAQEDGSPPTGESKTKRPSRKQPPSKQAPSKGNPGDEWQPASWSPGSARRRT